LNGFVKPSLDVPVCNRRAARVPFFTITVKPLIPLGKFEPAAVFPNPGRNPRCREIGRWPRSWSTLRRLDLRQRFPAYVSG